MVVSPELADVLSTIICRVGESDGAVPLVPVYDRDQCIWRPPPPVLFQRQLTADRAQLRSRPHRNGLMIFGVSGWATELRYGADAVGMLHNAYRDRQRARDTLEHMAYVGVTGVFDTGHLAVDLARHRELPLLVLLLAGAPKRPPVSVT